ISVVQLQCAEANLLRPSDTETLSLHIQDNEGQTALHYAVLCEREDIAELLVKHHADLQIKDGDGNTAQDLCSSAWPFMKPAN
uniref:Uncharacterized protein n=1 Tax=Aegilops tauschii subsp. strangulata TaxID=200361 RepID=A0A453DH89_AEGTS